GNRRWPCRWRPGGSQTRGHQRRTARRNQTLGDLMVTLDANRGGSLIQVRGLDKRYQRGSEEIHVLQGLNLNVDAGDFVAFMGPSGSGKTTLLNLLGGLDVPSAG